MSFVEKYEKMQRNRKKMNTGLLTAEEKDIQENRELAGFCYFLLFSPLFLFTKKKSPFLQFHAKQAFVLLILGIILAAFGGKISLGNILILFLCVTGLIQANIGKKWRIPVIAHIIETGIGQSLGAGVQSIFSMRKKSKSIFTKKTAEQEDPLEEIHQVLRFQKKRIDSLEKQIKDLTTQRKS